jgi:hypothetical protein
VSQTENDRATIPLRSRLSLPTPGVGFIILVTPVVVVLILYGFLAMGMVLSGVMARILNAASAG